MQCGTAFEPIKPLARTTFACKYSQQILSCFRLQNGGNSHRLSCEPKDLVREFVKKNRSGKGLLFSRVLLYRSFERKHDFTQGLKIVHPINRLQLQGAKYLCQRFRLDPF